MFGISKPTGVISANWLKRISEPISTPLSRANIGLKKEGFVFY